MDELDTLINNKTELSTKDWKNHKKEEKDKLYEMIDKSLEKIQNNPDNFKKYLDLQSKFSNYSLNNTMLIYSQKPESTRVRGFDEWKKYGANILNGEKGIMILEPTEKFTREDGTEGMYFNVKRVFDIFQTSSKIKERNNSYSNKVLLSAFLENYNIQCVDEIKGSNNVFWNNKDKFLYIKTGLEPKELFYSVLKELSYKEFDKKDEFRDFKSNCISYMICKKYNLDISNICDLNIPDELKKLDKEAFKKELLSMHDCFEKENSRINEHFEKLSIKNKEKER